MRDAKAPVYAAACADYSPERCRAAVAELADRFPALRDIAPGARVLVKANLVTALRPEKAATTHPALLAALTEYLSARGASVTIGDSPGGPFTKGYLEGVYAATGLRTTGAAINADFGVKHADFPEAAALRDFDYTGWLDGGDLIVNFCKLKSHGMMGLSCAVKNLFGAVPGLTKPAYHYRFPDYAQFADMLLDLNEYFRPAVNFVDAVTAMEGNGPTAGTPRHIGALFASESPYTLDLVCAGLIGLGCGQVPTLAAAARRGFAPESADAVPVVGDLTPFRTPDFDTASADAGMEQFLAGSGLGALFNRAARDILAVRPRLAPERCIGCGKCAGLCPAQAIALVKERPRIDRGRCIRCFCCQEFCPVGALSARRSALGDFALRHTQRSAGKET